MKTIEEWKVKDWDQIEIGMDAIIFYKIRDNKSNGFDFKILEETDGIIYALICHGSAFYDGIRHIHFGQNEEKPDGYLHEPILYLMVEYMKQLEKLEKLFCPEV